MLNKRWRETAMAISSIAAAMVITAMLLLMVLLSGCGTTKYVPVETVRTEYKDKVKEVQTSDTVINNRFVYVKGDTVWDFREKERVRTVEIHDTCFVEIVKEVEVPYPVERALSRWEQVKMDLGGLAIGGIVVVIMWIVVWLVKKVKR